MKGDSLEVSDDNSMNNPQGLPLHLHYTIHIFMIHPGNPSPGTVHKGPRYKVFVY